jgi:hypothetical protein
MVVIQLLLDNSLHRAHLMPMVAVVVALVPKVLHMVTMEDQAVVGVAGPVDLEMILTYPQQHNLHQHTAVMVLEAGLVVMASSEAVVVALAVRVWIIELILMV